MPASIAIHAGPAAIGDALGWAADDADVSGDAVSRDALSVGTGVGDEDPQAAASKSAATTTTGHERRSIGVASVLAAGHRHNPRRASTAAPLDATIGRDTLESVPAHGA